MPFVTRLSKYLILKQPSAHVRTGVPRVGRLVAPIASGVPSFIPRENTAESYLHSKRPSSTANERPTLVHVYLPARFSVSQTIPYAKSFPRRRLALEITFGDTSWSFASGRARNLSAPRRISDGADFYSTCGHVPLAIRPSRTALFFARDQTRLERDLFLVSAKSFNLVLSNSSIYLSCIFLVTEPGIYKRQSVVSPSFCIAPLVILFSMRRRRGIIVIRRCNT